MKRCVKCGVEANWTSADCPICFGQLERLCPSDATTCSSVGGDFYKGIEWLACWLLDNVEGEMITEEQLRPWAQKAWLAHLDRKNSVFMHATANKNPDGPET